MKVKIFFTEQRTVNHVQNSCQQNVRLREMINQHFQLAPVFNRYLNEMRCKILDCKHTKFM